jgi:predicted alpha/beta hydrolase
LDAEEVTIQARDGVQLGGHLWGTAAASPHGAVIINPATGVRARYYHYYARFLAEHGFAVLTYDYRGIGLSRPARLRGCGYRWRDWGELDFAAAVASMKHRGPDVPLAVVGHSIGGFLPGFAEGADMVDRVLTVGAQYAWWRDYAAERRAAMFMKWHVVMPAATALLGYFPGRRLGWLEDLPAGVAHEWSFRRARMEESYPLSERAGILARFAKVHAPILAVGLTDDDIGTPAAIGRALRYYTGSDRIQVTLAPADLGFEVIGHFGLFHARHAQGFWMETLKWLRDGANPWPNAVTSASEGT